MSEFFTQATNLLAQQLTNIKGEEIYSETACMDPEYRVLIGILRGLETASPKSKKPIEKLLPIVTMIGKASWDRSELTDLGLRVGQRNIETIRDDEIIDDANK